ncbi:SEC-C metal-binding domain-containing protein [Aquibacillus sp. 3ASR75-11]|uniref:SEC-C metal-binding domain-containing protein n=1 Tax=Terrihalobacillus insolitus TaxID=2950438 RepID=A0A9X3WV24_9BACI|nr:SEC-C metal-binding domain-containing protein [Terrihalobacillus insolitus]MDC3413534.1 SEC-C metal-binding domain-containing protein [Terrihalobacillus insolitus]MDC3426180.1 SEC-C metal-binding domain-containing protein [Terrihalobacillus insolitus]
MDSLNLTDKLQHELDELMQRGYTISSSGDSVSACTVWSELWKRILETMERYKIEYIEDMDKAFHGLQSIYNWSTDFETELGNALRKDKSIAQTRINFCNEYISKSRKKDDFNNLVKRRMVAESYFELGKVEEGEKLYSEFVREYPTDGWGWINWSDQYGLFANKENKNGEKAISILEAGLEIEGLKDRYDVLERLRNLYDGLDMKQKAKEIQQEVQGQKMKDKGQQLSDIRFINKKVNQSSNTISNKKIGRNAPCPCGSGKKYKKCCGK